MDIPQKIKNIVVDHGDWAVARFVAGVTRTRIRHAAPRRSSNLNHGANRVRGLIQLARPDEHFADGPLRMHGGQQSFLEDDLCLLTVTVMDRNYISM